MSVGIEKLQPGDRARVVGYGRSDKEYRRKLLSMGLTRGTEFRFVKRAPLGDPVEIEVRGFSLTLRSNEAGSLEIEPIEKEATHVV
jgi:ferrous iron transport protein A